MHNGQLSKIVHGRAVPVHVSFYLSSLRVIALAKLGLVTSNKNALVTRNGHLPSGKYKSTTLNDIISTIDMKRPHNSIDKASLGAARAMLERVEVTQCSLVIDRLSNSNAPGRARMRE